MNNHHSSHRRTAIRAAVAGAAVAAATATVVQLPPVAHASPPSAWTFCSLTPEADMMPVGPGLLSTTRAQGGEIEVLHRVTCDGRTVAWKWLSAADISAL